MTADDFYRTMIEKLEREPFHPFNVEMNDGRCVLVEWPNKVSIRGGLAAVTTRDCIYVRVDSEDVRNIVDATVISIPNGSNQMTADQLKAYQKTKPFRPFQIVLQDGKTYDVPHPDFLWVLTRTVYVGTHGDVERGLWDRNERFPLDLIKDVKTIAPSAHAEGAAGK